MLDTQMSAITVRGLGEETRDGLRRQAAARGMSVEALAREALAAVAAAGEHSMMPMTAPAGMAEQSMPWPVPAPVHGSATGFESLHGALAGRIHVAAETNITSPTGEMWDAEAGAI
jgi:plasmid stability protein